MFQLKVEFPSLELPLPRKRWFGDNFNPSFIEERAQGLQGFVDNVLKHGPLQLSLNVREFFCLDEPPCAVDSIDESRVIKCSMYCVLLFVLNNKTSTKL
jgi:sorting nexin-16